MILSVGLSCHYRLVELGSLSVCCLVVFSSQWRTQGFFSIASDTPSLVMQVLICMYDFVVTGMVGLHSH